MYLVGEAPPPWATPLTAAVRRATRRETRRGCCMRTSISDEQTTWLSTRVVLDRPGGGGLGNTIHGDGTTGDAEDEVHAYMMA